MARNERSQAGPDIAATRLWEKMEDRLLFDAVPDGSLDLLAQADEPLPLAEQRHTDAAVSDGLSINASTPQQRREIVFVDRSVDHYQTLVDELRQKGNTEIEYLDSDRDGLLQIADRLIGQSGIEAIHIISHGDSAALRLGNMTLDAESMAGYVTELAAIGDALSVDADVLIYGCSFGEGAQGAAVAGVLAELTGADIAASDDLTGSQSLGGDWDLELSIGVIETQSFWSANWAGLLASASDDTAVVNLDPTGTENTTGTISGNVLDNDTENNGNVIDVHAYSAAVGNWFDLNYGSIRLNADGSYDYDVNELHSAVIGLRAGEALEDIVSYRVNDSNGSDTGVLVITINGVDDELQAQDNVGLVTAIRDPTKLGDVILDDSSQGPDIFDRGLSQLIWENEYGNGASVHNTSRTVDGVTVSITAIDPDNAGTNSNQEVFYGTNGGHYGYLRHALSSGIDPNSEVTTTFDFSEEVSSLSFILADIDRDSTGPYSWQDQFAVVGTLAGQAVSFNALVAGTVIESPNDTFYGTGSVPTTEAHGNVNIVFQGAVDSVTLVYKNGPDVIASPTGILGAVSDLSWQPKIDVFVSEVDGVAADVGVPLALMYGTLVLNSDGSYNYTVDDTNAAVIAAGSADVLVDSVQYTLENTIGQQSIATLRLDVRGIDEPTIDLDANDSQGTVASDFLTSFNEGGAAVNLADVDVQIVDGDDTDLVSMTITPASIVNGANEELIFAGDGATSLTIALDGIAAASQTVTIGGVTLDVGYDGNDITITSSSGDIPIATLEALIASTTYRNTTTAAIPGNRTFAFSVNDGETQSNIATATVKVIPDYLSIASPVVQTFEDTSVPLGINVDPDLYLGGPLQDIIGVAIGYRADTAAALPTTFTIPDNVTGIVITGYSNRPGGTGANDIYNDDYQTLSARIDVAAGTASGNLAHHAELSSSASRVADQFSFIDSPLGSSVLTGGGTIVGETAAGTDPLFSIVGNELRIVENHDLQTTYHVEFMTSNRESTRFNGTLSDVQVPGDSTSTFTLPANTNYLVLTENAAQPGSDAQIEYKGFSRIIVDLDTMTASGTIATEIGETDDRVVAYSFENYDVSGSTSGGILGGSSTATVVGDTAGNAAVFSSPNIHINGAGELVVERSAGVAADFTSMFTIESYERTGYSSIATVVDSQADSSFFNATNNGDVVNSLSFSIPSSAKVGIFRISMATVGGNDTNENMATGYAVIDLESGTSSGSFTNIRANSPDLVSWNGVSLTDNVATGGIDERVFFTDPNTVSNRPSAGAFVDGWGATGLFNLVENPDGTRTITFEAVSNVGDNAYQDYQAQGEVTWLGNEGFRITGVPTQGDLSHGIDLGGGVYELDVADLPLLQFIPGANFSGLVSLDITLGSTGESEHIDIEVLPVADTPTLITNDTPATNEDTAADLSAAISAALVDADGSESITLIEIAAIPDGFQISDGTNSFTAGSGINQVDVTNWNLSLLQMNATQHYNGTVPLNVRVQTSDVQTINSITYSDITEPSDPAGGQREASDSFNVSFIPVDDPATLDLDTANAGTGYSGAFVENGGAVAISGTMVSIADVDDTAMVSLTITPGSFVDGAAETLTFFGDAASSITIPIDGGADATVQLTVAGQALDIAYDGTAITITDNGGGDITIGQLQSLIAAARYENSSPLPTIGNRTLDLVVNDGDLDSNVARSTLTVSRSSSSAEWSLTGTSSVDEGGTADVTLMLSGTLSKAGETAQVDLSLVDVETSSSDYADFATAVQTAVSTRPDLAYNAGTGTLTYTSDGVTPMSPLLISLTVTDDSVAEGAEDYRVELSNASSTTGEVLTIDVTSDRVQTTIQDTQGIGGAPDQADWSIAGTTNVDEGGAAIYTIAMDRLLQAGEDGTIEISVNELETTAADHADVMTAIQTAVASRTDLSFDAPTGTLTFVSSGSLMSDLVFTVAAIDDTLIEGPERIQLLLSNSSSSTGTTVGIDPAKSEVTTTIADTISVGGASETAIWSFGIDQTVSEGNSANYLLSMAGELQSGERVEVDLLLSDIHTEAADYADFDAAVSSAVATYNGGVHPGVVAWDGATLAFISDGSGVMDDFSFTLGTTNDVAAEGVEDFRVSLVNANSPTGAAVAISSSNDDAVTTIDDTIGPGSDQVVWSVTGNPTVNEGGSLSYTFALAGAMNLGEDANVVLTLVDIDTDASDYADFIAAVDAAAASRSDLSFDVATRTLTYTAPANGASMADFTVVLGVTDDSKLEGSEAFDVRLSNSGSTTGVLAGIDSIANIVMTTVNDTAGDTTTAEAGGEWAITGNTSVSEGDSASYSISISGDFQAGEMASVDLSFTDLESDSADRGDFVAAVQSAVAAFVGDGALAFDSGTGRLTFTADAVGTMTPLVVSLATNGDTFVEGPERYRIDLSNPLSSTGILPSVSSSQSSVTSTISDGQNAFWSLAGSASTDEGGSAGYTLSLAGILQAGETSAIQFSLADVHTNASDYSDLTAAIQTAAAARSDLAFDAATNKLTYTGDGSAMVDFSFALSVNDDSLNEGPENFRIQLINPSSGTGAGTFVDTTADRVVTTIKDTQGVGGAADGPGQWNVAGTGSVDEGGTALYTISLSSGFGVGEVVTVYVNAVNLSSSLADYSDFLSAMNTAVSSNPDVTFDSTTGMLTFVSPAENAMMSDVVVSLSVTDDNLVEGSEQFRIELSGEASASGAAIALANASVTTTIDDTQGDGGALESPAAWNLAGASTVDEGGMVAYTLSLAGAMGAGELVSVDLNLSDIDSNSSDYGDVLAAIATAVSAHPDLSFDTGSDRLTYSAPSDGATMSDLNFSLPISNDTLIEGAEQFALHLSGELSSTGAGIRIANPVVTTTINDTNGVGGMVDGPALWNLAGTASVDEGSSASYTISLSGALGASESVSVALTLNAMDTNGSDYSDFLAAINAAVASDPNVSFNPVDNTLTYISPADGSSMSDVVITMSLTDDAFIEGEEQFSLQLAMASSSSGAAVGISNDQVITTVGDTQGPAGAVDGPGLWNVAGPTGVDEGGNAVHTISLSGSYGEGEIVSVKVNLNDLTTRAGDHGDIHIALANAAAATAGASYDSATSTLTFVAASDGATMADMIVTLPVVDDAIVEGSEQYSITLSDAASSTDAAVALGTATVTTTINDTQGVGGAGEAPVSWNISGPSNRDEGSTAPLVVSLAGNLGAGETASVVLALSDIDTDSNDHGDLVSAINAAVAGDPDLVFDSSTGTLTYTAASDGASMTDLLITLSITDDSWIEGDEAFSIALSSPGSTSGAAVVIGAATATTTIVDTQGVGGAKDGPATWSVSGDTSVDEGATATYTIALSGSMQAGEDTTVLLGLTNVTTNSTDHADFIAAVQAAVSTRPELDFNSSTGELTFWADGNSLSDLVIQIAAVDDSQAEGPESYRVSVSSATSGSGAAVAISSSNHRITTTINDTQGPGGAADTSDWAIVGSSSVDEGGIANFAISLDALLPSGQSATVDVAVLPLESDSLDHSSIVTAIESAVASRSDLTFDSSTGTLTFTSSGLLMSDLAFSVTATDDAKIEGPERFQILLSNPSSSSGASIGIDPSTDNSTTTINDTHGIGGANETALWALASDQTVAEGSSASYTISLSGDLQAGEVVEVIITLWDLSTDSSDHADLSTAISNAAAAYAGPGSLGFDSATGLLTFTSDGAGPMSDLSFSLASVDDMIAEGKEDFRIALSGANSPTGASVLIAVASDDAVATIDDTFGSGSDDATWSLLGDASIDEGGTIGYTLRLAGTIATNETAKVVLGLNDISTDGLDHAALTTAIATAVASRSDLAWDAVSGTLTYTGDGTPMSDLTINLAINDDTILEGPEQLAVVLSDPSSDTGILVGIDATAGSVTSTIDDTAGDGGPAESGGVWSIDGATNIAEGVTANYSLRVSGDLQNGERVSVQLALADLESDGLDHANFLAAVQTAVAAYTSPGSLSFDAATGTLTFQSDGTGAMADLDISLNIAADSIAEGPERYRIDMTAPTSDTGLSASISSTSGSSTTTINDLQSVTWSVASPVTVDEGATASIVLSLSGTPQAAESVSIDLSLNNLDTTASDHADFIAAVDAAAQARSDLFFDITTGTLTYTSDGSPMADVSIDLAVNDDAAVEGDEAFEIVLANPASATGVAVFIDPSATTSTTVIADTNGAGGPADQAFWSIQGATMADEGAIVILQLSLNGTLQAGEDAAVKIQLVDLATDPLDHAALATVVQSAVGGYAGPGTLSYDGATETVTFVSDGSAMTNLTIEVPISDDNILEGDEDFRVELASASSSTGGSIAIDAAGVSVTTTIADTQGVGGAADGPAEWSVTSTGNVDEGAIAQFTISLSEVLQAGETASVIISLSDLDTSASDHGDLATAIAAAVASRSDLSFDSATGTLTYTGNGNPMTDLVVALSIVDDSAVEGPESFRLNLSGPSSSSGVAVGISASSAQATTSINDTQGPGGAADRGDWSIIGSATVDEGGTANYTISLDAALQAGEVVTIEITSTDLETTAADHDDFLAALAVVVGGRSDLDFDISTGTLTHTSSGLAMPDIAVAVATNDDALAEGPERFQLSLANAQSPTGAVVGIDPSAAIVSTTIADTVGSGGPSEQAVWAISGATLTDEGNTAQYTLSLTGTLQAGETATVQLALDEIDTTPADHADFVNAVQTAVAARSELSFDTGSSTLTYTGDGNVLSDLVIDLPIHDDVLVEGSEDYRVILLAAGSGTGVDVVIDSTSDVSVTTINDTDSVAGSDTAVWSLSGSTDIDEGEAASFTLSLAGTLQVGETARVRLDLADLETDAADYDSFVFAVQTAISARPDLAFDTATGTLTYIGDGSPMSDLVISLGTVNDSFVEGPERFAFALIDPSSTTGAAIGINATSNSVTTTVNDTVSAGGAAEMVLWSISGAPQVDEGGTATWTISLSGTMQAGETSTVTISLTEIDTTVGDHADLNAAMAAAVASRSDLSFNVATGELTYTADGTPMNALNVSLAVSDDTKVEGPEAFNIALSDPISLTGSAVAIVGSADDLSITINDTIGDGGPVESASWSVTSPASIDEGDTATIVIALDGTLQNGETAYVNLARTDLGTDSGDYSDFVTAVNSAVAGYSGPGSLSFDSATGRLLFSSNGLPMSALSIDLAITDDNLVEGSESMQVALSLAGSTSGSSVDIDAGKAVSTLTIQDTIGIGGSSETVAWSIDGSANVAEGGTASYTITLAGILQVGEVVSVDVLLTDFATESADHSDIHAVIAQAIANQPQLAFDVATGTLTYTSDGTPMEPVTFSIAALLDNVIEGDEGFAVSLSRPASTTGAGATISGGSVTSIIVDHPPADSNNPLGSPPIANDDVFMARENGSLGGSLLSNDGDPDGDVINITTAPAVNPSNGSVTIQSDGTFVYTPAVNFVGTDSFRYTITDPSGNIATATVTIQVAADENGPANDAPVAANDTLITQKNTPATGDVLANDTDADANPLLVIAVDGNPVSTPTTITTAAGGSVTMNADGTFAYTPGNDFVGSDSFVYTMQDGAGGSDTAVVYLSVFDSAPLAVDDLAVALSDTPVSGNVLANDVETNPDDTLTVNTTPTVAPQNGSLLLLADGSFTYTPDAGFVGSDSFSYEVCDEAGNCDTATLWIEVRENGAANGNAPIATADIVSAEMNTTFTGSLTANDGDPDGDVISVDTTPVSGPSSGTLTIQPDGTFSYTPTPGFIGTDTFTYSISDPSGNIATATVNIAVLADNNGPANNAPSAADDVGIGQKNISTTGNVLANDSDLNGDVLTVVTTPVSGPTNGTLTLQSDGAYSYTPNDDFVGTDSFRYQVSDSNGGTAVATVLLAVFDNAPRASADIASVLTNSNTSGNVLTNDTDPNPNDTLSVSEVDGQPLLPGGNATAAGGLVVMNANGSYTYSPASNFSGSDSFTYTMCDEGGNCDTATVTIEVRDTSVPPNNAPVSNDDSAFAFTNSSVNGNVLSNDYDPDGGVLTVATTPVVGPSNGSVTLNADGTFSYVPNSGFNGSDTFTYQVCDALGDCSQATVTVTISPDPNPAAGDPPVAADDVVAGKTGSAVTGNLLGNDSDPNGDPLIINLSPVTPPANGTVTINSDGTFTYLPASGFVGTDSFVYEVCDAQGYCDTAMVTIEISNPTPPNAPPIVNGETFVTFTDTPVSGSLISNDSDPEGGVLTINTTPLSGPAAGSITIHPDGTFDYTPAIGFNGTDSVSYEVCDADGVCGTATLIIEVRVDSNGAANDAPTTNDDMSAGPVNQPISGNLLANDNDPNGDPLIINQTPVVPPSSGIIVINSDGSYVYTPNNDFVGTDSFTYEVCDAAGDCSYATVQISVFNRPPVIISDQIVMAPGTTATGNLLANDSDPDVGDSLTMNTVPLSGPSNGTLVLNGDGTFSYTPNPGFVGVDTFSYEVCDEFGACKSGAVSIAMADLSNATEVTSMVANGDVFDVTFAVVVENTGASTLSDIRVINDLQGLLGNRLVSVAAVSIDSSGMSPSSTPPTLQPGWTTSTGQSMVDPATTSLLPGESFLLQFTATIDPDAGGTSSGLALQTTVTGIDTSDPANPILITDSSDSGFDPRTTNPSAPGDTGTADDPTPIHIPDAGVANEVIDIAQSGTGFDLTIRLTLENTGTTDLNDIALWDDLAAANNFAANFAGFVSPPTIVESTATTNPALNSAYQTDTSENIFAAGGLLTPGQSITIEMVVHIESAAGGGSSQLSNQALGGGQPIDGLGNPLNDLAGLPFAAVIDASDSGPSPNLSNSGAPGDTGSTDDATATSLTFFTYDSFNDFSGKGDPIFGSPGFSPTELFQGTEQSETQDVAGIGYHSQHRRLSQDITRLAPEPIFSGSARPGTQIIGKIYSSSGALLGETRCYADVGGNWMMQFHNLNSSDHAQIRFEEVPGIADTFSPGGDIFGYLGADQRSNDYAALEPWTPYQQSYDFTAVYRQTASNALKTLHRLNQNPLGFGGEV